MRYILTKSIEILEVVFRVLVDPLVSKAFFHQLHFLDQKLNLKPKTQTFQYSSNSCQGLDYWDDHRSSKRFYCQDAYTQLVWFHHQDSSRTATTASGMKSIIPKNPTFKPSNTFQGLEMLHFTNLDNTSKKYQALT